MNKKLFLIPLISLLLVLIGFGILSGVVGLKIQQDIPPSSWFVTYLYTFIFYFLFGLLFFLNGLSLSNSLGFLILLFIITITQIGSIIYLILALIKKEDKYWKIFVILLSIWIILAGIMVYFGIPQ